MLVWFASTLLALSPEVGWEAPAPCPSLAAVQQQIEGYTRGRPVPPGLRIEGEVEAVERRWRLRLVVVNDGGRLEPRTLEAARCEALARAFALIAAVRIDALRTRRRVVELQRPTLEPEPEPAQTPEPPPVLERTPSPRAPDRARSPRSPSRPSPKPTRRRPRPALGGLLRLESGVSAGIMPGLGPSMGLMGGLTGRGWRVELGAGGWPARSARDPASGLGVRLDLITARLRGCWVPGVRRLTAPICAGGEAGGLRGIGSTGVSAPVARWTPLGVLTVGGALAWAPRPWIAPLVGVQGAIALPRPRFSVGAVPVAQAGTFGIRAWVGIELRLASRDPARSETIDRRP